MKYARLSDLFRRARAPEMSDKELANEFHPVWREGTGEEAADMLRCRMRSRSRCFLPSLKQRRKVVEMMNRRFPAERDAIIKTAEAPMRGKFSLLDHAHFVTLGQAYWLTNDNRFAEGFRDQVSAWIDANPAPMGINGASGLEAALRSTAWLWATLMLVDSREVTPDFFARLLKSLIEHGLHIERYLSHYISPNTHPTGEALGLFYLGLALPEMSRATGWRDLGLRILLEQAQKQASADGVHFEQSSYYHLHTADFYMRLLVGAAANDIKLDRESEILLWQKLEAMLNHLMWITRPDGSSPLFGDDGGGRSIKLIARAANDFRDTLAIGSAILKRGDWKYVAGEAPAEMLWLIGPQGVEHYDQLRAKPPCEISRGFKPSGHFVMRDGWRRNSSFVLIDCWPHGAEACCGRPHSDALSIEFASRGVTWIVDPCAYVYAADAKTRDDYRSTATHNTATVDDQPQSVASTPFSWRKAAKCRLHVFIERGEAIFFQGSHDGYERLKDPVKHTRSVLFVKADARDDLPEYLIVRDRFTAKKRHRYAIRYHLAPGCEARSGAGSVEARHRSGANLTIRVICEACVKTQGRRGDGATGRRGDMAAKRLQIAQSPSHPVAPSPAKVVAKVIEGWVSPCYAQCAPAPVALFEAEGEGTQEFLTLIIPGALDQAEAVERQILKRWRAGPGSSGRRSLEIVKLPGSAGGR